MKYAILLHTADYRGDHAADICRVIEPIEGETIEQLIDRVGLGTNKYAVGEYIALRLVERLPSKAGTHVLVPREPTPEMMAAGCDALDKGPATTEVLRTYSAMLRAVEARNE